MILKPIDPSEGTQFMKFSSLLLTMGLLLQIGASANAADDVIASVRDRFKPADVDETPDFQKHVVPLMSRLGCNGRACHGSFQGAGGLQLSLFGYDFKMDHEGLIDRVDTDDPAESYAIHKPTMIEPHEGGKRYDKDSWEYRVFLNWVKAGAKGIDTPLELKKLDVTPREIVFSGEDQKQQLKVIAVWADGTREDVTCLCRYTTNDDVIAAIDEEGIVSSGEAGDSHVVVSYDGAVVPIPVLRPVGKPVPAIATRTEIDRHVANKLAKMGIVPSEICDDAEFLRRVSLDIAGTLPSSAKVRSFLNDRSPDKRERVVDELLETPAYAAWWTVQLCDWTGCSDTQLNNVNPVSRQRGSQSWYDWVYQRVEENMPYDEIAENIVVASSRRNGESYREYSARMTDYERSKTESFADNEGLIYYWGRANFRQTEDRAIGFAYTFMGTRIQCAQCHKHPFDVWTQDDFTQFETFFERVTFARNGSDRAEYTALIKELKLDNLKGNELRRAMEKAMKDKEAVIPFPEVVISRAGRAPKTKKKKNNRNQKPPEQLARLLGETDVNLATIKDPRTALMDWLRNSPTKLFAKSYVNRVWANYFNRGIVEPTDDLSLANPPSNQALLDYLVDGFIAHDYDMKWLHREICLSDTYQRSWRPNETNKLDERNFSRAVPRRLPAEVAYDALTMATASDAVANAFAHNLKDRATTSTSPPRNNGRGADYALSVFGRSLRESNCDCDRSSEASLLQTLFVRNDDETLEMITRRDGWLAQWQQELNVRPSSDNSKLKRAESSMRARLSKLRANLAKAKRQNNTKQIANIKKQVAAAQAQLEKLPSAPGGKVELDADRLIDEAYLRTLSRFPNKSERELAETYLTDASDTMDGVKDLVWALINTKEFIVNH